MTQSNPASKGGLEGVAVADSAISLIDGSVGELRYRGYLIKELADHSDFAETAHLLWHGELPTSVEHTQLTEQLRAARKVPEECLSVLRAVASYQEPMDALRTAVSAMPDDVDGDPQDPDANLQRAINLTARLPILVATYERLRKGQPVLESRDDLDDAANFLYLLTGKEPTEEAARVFDVCLILHAEHGFNASTFSGRVTAATLSDLYSSVTAAIGTLKGPLHGGANTAVMNTLLEIGSEDGVEAWLDGALARREKIMGFGHRVYKVVDPRALILKEFSRRIGESYGEPKWFRMSEKLEAAMKDRKGIDVNVDFYSASLYYALGIPQDLFTCLFAMSRVTGWTAHILEQYANNRLIRPRSNWVGPAPRDYVTIDQRG